MIYIGIDVAKEKHDCCIIDSDGVILNDSLRISNTLKGFELLYNSILSVLPGVASGKCGFHTLRAFSPLIPMVCRLFRYSKVYIVL